MSAPAPRVQVVGVSWASPDGAEAPGVAVVVDDRLALWLEPARAVALADALVDTAEGVEMRPGRVPALSTWARAPRGAADVA